MPAWLIRSRLTLFLSQKPKMLIPDSQYWAVVVGFGILFRTRTKFGCALHL